MNVKLLLLAVVICMTNISAMAATETITLQKYFQASCQDYTGTWQGFITDPSGLMGNGGPWPVTLNLYHEKGQVWGRSSAFTYASKNGSFKQSEVWARCQDGKLQNIFWGKKDACGSLSEQGMLVSKNVMVLQFNWENAMTGTQFLLFLQRKNHSGPYYEPSHMRAFDPAAIKSCH